MFIKLLVRLVRCTVEANTTRGRLSKAHRLCHQIFVIHANLLCKCHDSYIELLMMFLCNSNLVAMCVAITCYSDQ